MKSVISLTNIQAQPQQKSKWSYKTGEDVYSGVVSADGKFIAADFDDNLFLTSSP
ncbi:MAG: PQQ-binding-like beta-propeller repeat protein [Thermoproteales archaeon]|nr:PQQ-binding-like beta-propeller repeat protein [Thermoproteales archaeon]